jgi:hypothetical protein
MVFQLLKPSVGIALVIGGKVLVPLNTSAMENSIFAGQQSFVGHGAISLTDLPCVDRPCSEAARPSLWNQASNGGTPLFEANTVTGRTETASKPTTSPQASRANSLRSTRGEEALLAMHQTETGNRITSVQDPSAVAVSAVLIQAGYDNQIIGLQQGSHNVATIVQSGNQNVSAFIQTGAGNALTVRQR